MNLSHSMYYKYGVVNYRTQKLMTYVTTCKVKYNGALIPVYAYVLPFRGMATDEVFTHM